MKYIYLVITVFTFSQMAVSQTCNDSIVASTPDSHFSVNEQEVTDTETGLIWQKCSLGQTGNDCSAGSAQKLSWSAALQAAETEAQKTDKAWRLPNIKELRSIVEERCSSPAINLTIFPNMPASSSFPLSHSIFWSASPCSSYSNSGNCAWSVWFSMGHYDSDSLESNFYVRLVRNVQ
jgi:hypothetical protein